MEVFRHPLFKTFIVVALILASVPFALVMWYPKAPSKEKNLLSVQPIQSRVGAQPLTPQIDEAHSSDGTMKLIMQAVRKVDMTVTYSFFTTEISGENKRLLFTKSAAPTESMTIPKNSWSPDNKFLYIQDASGGVVNVLVFKASGELFSNGQQSLDVLSLYNKRELKYSFKEVTGWDSPTLLHVVTTMDQKKGPSFWFDVESKSFIQLAR